jgi:hypothetical protein
MPITMRGRSRRHNPRAYPPLCAAAAGEIRAAMTAHNGYSGPPRSCLSGGQQILHVLSASPFTRAASVPDPDSQDGSWTPASQR